MRLLMAAALLAGVACAPRAADGPDGQGRAGTGGGAGGAVAGGAGGLGLGGNTNASGAINAILRNIGMTVPCAPNPACDGGQYSMGLPGRQLHHEHAQC